MSSSFLYLNDLRIHYLQWGEPDGFPVILLHGLASNARIWEMVAPPLAERGLRLLAWDARGHGLSDKPDGDYGFDPFVRDLAAFIEACRLEHPLLVGHSWGGHLALEYAARFTVGPRAPCGLALVDGGLTQMNDSPGMTWETMRQILTPPPLKGLPVEEFTARIRQMTARWGVSEQIISIFLASFAIDENETITPHLSLERHMQIVRALWDHPTYDCFPRLRCPVLAIPARPAGALSPGEEGHLRLKERGVAKAQASIPDLRLHWMPDTIHDIPLQRPAELAALIADFCTPLCSDPLKPPTSPPSAT